MKYLKPIRVGVSLVLFLATAVLFLDFIGWVVPSWSRGITFLQFLPSLLKFVHAAGLLTAGFIVVLLLTLLFGRVYCSSICPLGTLQDGVTFLARKVNSKAHQRRRKRQDLVRYGLLAVTSIGLLAGITTVATFLDPFSVMGRVLSVLVRPGVIAMNNGIAWVLGLVRVYAVYTVDMPAPGWVAVGATMVLLCVVAWLAYTRGRLYCNMLCPVGALLGLVSRVALFKVAIDEHDCKGCNLCERVCKGGCIDGKARSVDFDRCVMCFNCFDACPRGDLELRLPWQRRSKDGKTDGSRRKFVTTAVGALAAMAALPGAVIAAGKTVTVKKPTTLPTGALNPVSPPGSGSVGHFTSTCTACHLCISACPSHVLQPSVMEYGIGGVLQPRMDYHSAYCNFECVKCGEVCPSGAILALVPEQKKLTQIGTAKFYKDNCVVNTEGTDCGACSEHCPTKAVTMVPFRDKLVIPEVRTEFCIGCGACEHACPTRPYRAIIVEGQLQHAQAKKPEEQKLEQLPAPAEDFPF